MALQADYGGRGFHCNSRYDNQSTFFSEINQILNYTSKTLYNESSENEGFHR